MSLFQSLSIQGVNFQGLAAQPTQVFPNQFANIAQMNIQCHPDMKGMLPHIAAYIHNFIAQRATQNLPRAIHFNMLVTQGNSELFILTTLITNMAFIRVKQGQIQNINDAISQCTDWAVTRRVNFITINVPELFNQMQSEAGSISQMANEYVMEANSTLEAMGQIYMGGTSGFNNGQQQQQNHSIGGFSGGMAATGFGNQNQNNNGGGFGMAPATGFGNSNGGNNRGGIGGVIVRADSVNPGRTDRFNDDLSFTSVTDMEPKAAPAPASAATAPKSASVLEHLDRGLDPASHVKPADKPVTDENGNLIWANLAPVKAPWQQSRFQSHPVMFDGSRFDINRRGFTIGEKNFVVDTLKKAPVDRKSLSLPPAAQFLEQVAPADKNRQQFREESLIKATALLSTVRDLTQEAEYLERTEELRNNGHFVFKNALTSLPESLAAARQAAMQCSNIEFGAFTSEFFLAKEFVVLKEDAQQLIDLSKCRTIATLVDAMSTIVQDPHSSHSLRVAVVQLNFYLAQSWMEWLRFYLCLDEFSGSNSFIDDALPMRDDIADIAGDHFRKMVDRNQQRFIQTYLAFGQPQESDLDIVGDPNKEAQGNARGVVTVPIMTPTLLVCTEFLDCEFALTSSAEIDGRDIGCNFDENTTTPGFRKLVQTLLERPRSIGLQSQIRRFYIATLDNVMYEVNMGLNEEAAPLLIKKVR